MRDIERIWADVAERIRYEVNPTSFDLWIAPIKPVSYENGKFTVAIEEQRVKDVVESIYKTKIEQKLSALLDDQAELVIGSGRPDNFSLTDTPTAPGLNPKYKFDTFVVGESNRMAHAAAMAIAESFPEIRFNPFFLYSGVGLGKTHLIHAIGNEIYRLHPEKKILYVSSEAFANEVISAIRAVSFSDDGERTGELRRKYRDVDVLMIDDIQFIAGKKSTESEFFHTFNTLFLENKQIIITSDRAPNAIPNIDSRMTTRFSSGIVMDIQSPDFETRAAILRNRAAQEGVKVDAKVLDAIAQRVDSNIRELEGAFNTILAHAQLTKSAITYDLIDRVLKDMVLAKESHRITCDMVVSAVADYYNVPVDEIKGKKRDKMIALTRQLVMYLCRNLTESSFKDIGDAIGGKHYTTVIHACETITERLAVSPGSELQVAIDDITERLKNL